MNKPPAVLEPLHHRGGQYIKVNIPNQENVKALVKQVHGRKWSRTHGCWYVPYTPEVYRQLKELFDVRKQDRAQDMPAAAPAADVAPIAPPLVGQHDIPPPASGVAAHGTKMASQAENQELPCLRIEREGDYRMKAFVPWQQKDWIEKIKSIPGRAWKQEEKYWSLPMVQSAVRQLKEWFGEQVRFSFDLPADMPAGYRPANWRQPLPMNESSPTPPAAHDISPELRQVLPAWMLNQAPNPSDSPDKPTGKQQEYAAGATHDSVKAIRSQENKSTVFLKVPAHRRDWIDFVKSIPGARWIPAEKLWALPRTQENFDRCKAYWGDGWVVGEELPKLPADNRNHNKTSTGTTLQTAISSGSHATIPAYAQRPGAQPMIGEILKQGKKINAVVGNQIIVNQLDGQWLAVYVPHDRQDWVEKIRTVPGRSWDVTRTCWRAPLSKETLRLLHHAAKENLVLGFTLPQDIPDRIIVQKAPRQHPPKVSLFYQLTEKQKAAVTALEKQLTIERKGYQTIKGYRNHFIQFLYFFKETLPSQITPQQIKEYIYQRIKNDNISKSTHSGIYSALQAFYIRVLEKPEKLAMLERPPKENKLPRDLDKDEIERLLRTITYSKHKCLLSVMYSSGIRVGELVRLRLEDVDLDAKTVFVYQSKNNKDRFTVLGEKIIPKVKAYLEECKPQYWLFEGPDGEPYTVRSVQEVFKRARIKAGIRKNVSTHALRHSFATHNLAKGIDIELLRNLMGHESLKTTQIYLHVTKERLLGTPSPFDDLDI